MKSAATTPLYDSSTGADLLSVKEAAEYLDYHPISIYRLVKQKALKFRRVGQTLLFEGSDLEKYKHHNRWAAKKANVKQVTGGLPVAPKTMEAELSVDFAFSPLPHTLGTLKNFAWADLPKIRADIHRVHGDRPFSLSVKSPEGGVWTVEYAPPSFFENLVKRVKGS